MTKLHFAVSRFYDKVILEHPGIVILCLLAVWMGIVLGRQI